jgi:hypothetical protein
VFPAQPILLEFLDGSVNHQFSYTQDDPVNQTTAPISKSDFVTSLPGTRYHLKAAMPFT